MMVVCLLLLASYAAGSNNFDKSLERISGKPELLTVSGDSAAVQTQVIPPSAIPGRINPGLVYPKDRIFEYLRAAISSGSAKTWLVLR